MKNWWEIGELFINENRGFKGDLWFLIFKKFWRVVNGYNWGLVVFCWMCRVVDWLECLKCGILSFIDLFRGLFFNVICFVSKKCCFVIDVWVILLIWRNV